MSERTRIRTQAVRLVEPQAGSTSSTFCAAKTAPYKHTLCLSPWEDQGLASVCTESFTCVQPRQLSGFPVSLCLWVEMGHWDWNEIERICQYSSRKRKYLHPGCLVSFQLVTLKFIRLYGLKMMGFLNLTDSSSLPKWECARSFSLPAHKKD